MPGRRSVAGLAIWRVGKVDNGGHERVGRRGPAFAICICEYEALVGDDFQKDARMGTLLAMDFHHRNEISTDT